MDMGLLYQNVRQIAQNNTEIQMLEQNVIQHSPFSPTILESDVTGAAIKLQKNWFKLLEWRTVIATDVQQVYLICNLFSLLIIFCIVCIAVLVPLKPSL